MLTKSNLRKIFFCLTVLMISNTVAISPAMAGRYVLNQTPATIAQYLGKPERKTIEDRVWVYEYSPPEFKKLFAEFPNITFSIKFVDQKAKYITINFNGDFDSYPEYNYEGRNAAKFFEYIFGYEPPDWREISSKFTGNETVYDYEYCLGDGVGTRFTRWGYKQVTDDATMYYNSACEVNQN